VQILVVFPSIFFFWILTLTFRRLAILEWLLVTPDFVPLPQISQTLLIKNKQWTVSSEQQDKNFLFSVF
jgi:hypothetical protein